MVTTFSVIPVCKAQACDVKSMIINDCITADFYCHIGTNKPWTPPSDNHLVNAELVTPDSNAECYDRFTFDGSQISNGCKGEYNITYCTECVKQEQLWKGDKLLSRQYYGRHEILIYVVPVECVQGVSYGIDDIGFWVTSECQKAVLFYCKPHKPDENLPLVYRANTAFSACQYYQTFATCSSGTCTLSDRPKSNFISVSMSGADCDVNYSTADGTVETCPEYNGLLSLSSCGDCSLSTHDLYCAQGATDSQVILHCTNETTYVVDYKFVSGEEAGACRDGDTYGKDDKGIYIQAGCVAVNFTYTACNGQDIFKDVTALDESTTPFVLSSEVQTMSKVFDDNSVSSEGAVSVSLLDFETTAPMTPDSSVSEMISFETSRGVSSPSYPTTLDIETANHMAPDSSISEMVQFETSSIDSSQSLLSTPFVSQPDSVQSTNTRNFRWCPCSYCVVQTRGVNQTNQYYLDSILSELRINSSQTSLALRKKISIPDDRPSSITIGSFGVIVIVIVLSTLIIFDVSNMVISIDKAVKKKRRK